MKIWNLVEKERMPRMMLIYGKRNVISQSQPFELDVVYIVIMFFFTMFFFIP